MYEVLDLGKAFDEFCSLSGWKGISAEDAVESFVRYCQSHEDPELIRESCVIWQREDFRAAFKDRGVNPNEDMVDEAIDGCYNMCGWRDMAIGHGNDHIHEIVLDVLDRRSQKQPKDDLKEEVGL